MSAKATVLAPANIAFIKYWGAKDLDQAVPVNTSVSMTLTECTSLSTVEFEEGGDGPDRIEIVGEAGTEERERPRNVVARRRSRSKPKEAVQLRGEDSGRG